MSESTSCLRGLVAVGALWVVGCSGTDNGAPGGLGGTGGTGGPGGVPCQDGTAGNETCASIDPRLPFCVAGSCAQCRDAGDCEGTTPICEANACAPCGLPGPSDACAVIDSAAPVCAESGACVECADHEDCASEVCDRDQGTCVPETQIVYVANGGFLGDQETGADTPGCGIPQTKCESIIYAVENRLDDASGRTWIRVADGEYDGLITVENQTARIIGGEEVRFSQLAQGDGTTTLIDVDEGVDLLIDRLIVTTGGPTTIGLSCRGELRVPSIVTLRRSVVRGASSSGVRFDDYCSGEVTDSTIERNGGAGLLARGSSGTITEESLVVLRSAIVNNEGEGIVAESTSAIIERNLIERNRGGGIAVRDSDFVIRNNFIQDNGRDSAPFPSSVGGVVFRDDGPEPRIFEFNTVVGNEISEFAQTPAGVACSTGAPIEVSSSIVWDNVGTSGDIAVTNPQVGFFCEVSYSDVQGGVSPENHNAVGPGNIDTDPLFVDVFRGDYRIGPDSLARDAADPDATLDIDHDGTTRPQGPQRDMGAYEVPSP